MLTNANIFRKPPALHAIALTCIVLTRFGGASALASEVGRLWTIESSIAARYIVDTDAPGVFANPAHPVTPSPDGRKFAILTRRGDLKSDQNIFELTVYDTTAVAAAVERGEQPPRALVRVQRRSTHEEPWAIYELKWAADSQSLNFISGIKIDDPELGSQLYSGEEPIRRALYFLDVATGRTEMLCPASTNSDRGSRGAGVGEMVDSCGETSIYVDFVSEPQRSHFEFNYPATVIDPKMYFEALGRRLPTSVRQALGHWDNYPALGLFSYVHGQRKLLCTLSVKPRDYALNVVGAIAPRGDKAIVAVPIDASKRELWGVYDNAGGAPNVGNARWLQYIEINLASGTIRPTIDAPLGSVTKMGSKAWELRTKPVWSPDGHAAILPNVALPLSEKSANRETAWIVVYRPEHDNLERVAPLASGKMKAVAVKWSDDSQKVIVEWNSGSEPNRTSTYKQQGTKWTEVSDAGAPAESAILDKISWQDMPSQMGLMEKEAKALLTNGFDSRVSRPGPQPFIFGNGLELILEEDHNTPQQLVARMNGHSATLIGPDPALDGISIAKTTTFEWTTPDGHLHYGDLTLPVSVSGHFPSLVVRPHSFEPNVFRPDGNVFGGLATLAFASRGIAVLRISYNDTTERMAEPQMAPLEAERMRVLMDAAIDKLATEELVDPTRIAIDGFSHSGNIARTLLINAGRYPLAAASANDGFSTNLSVFHSQILQDETFCPGRSLMNGSLAQQVASYVGGPFSQSSARWLRESPDLAARFATGPLLEIQHTIKNDRSLFAVSYAGIVGSFIEARRPIEYMAFPDGGHWLERPLERFASYIANLDWFDFWLNNHERTEPSAATGETQEMLTEKYTRWRKMKVDWERQQAWEAAGHPAGSIPAKDFKVEPAAPKKESDPTIAPK